MQVNMLEAKNCLSALFSAVEPDEEVIIVRNGVPVAKIVKHTTTKIAAPGIWKGQVSYNPDWDSAETNRAIAELFTTGCSEILKTTQSLHISKQKAHGSVTYPSGQ